MKIEYEFTKADQCGEKVKGKNIYANPFDPRQCSFTGLGIFLSLNRGSFHKRHHFFIRAGKIGSAAGKYCIDLVSLLRKHQAIAEQYCRTDRTGSHGTRKGAGTYSTSGTTFPPPLSSVAHRGDWSQGHVFDVYLQFADPGDQYLGRILAGLDPNTSEFASLPPHFVVPSTNKDVEEALVICFGDLAEKYCFKGQLMLCLASMVYHIEWIKETAATFPGHPFNLLPILRRPGLVQRLKAAAVSTAPSEYLSQATGIPPHVNQLRIIKEVSNSLQSVVLKLDDLLVHISHSVLAAIESNDIRSGNVTMNSLKEHLHDFGNELSIQILQKLEREGLLSVPRTQHQVAVEDNDVAIGGEETTANLPTYSYRVKGSECTNWDVPLNYCFPQKISRENGWQAWVLGFPGHQGKGADGSLIPAPIRPVRSIRPQFLSTKKLRDDLKTQWKPVFAMMEEGILLEQVDNESRNKLPKNSSCCSEALVSRLYEVGTAYLMHRASYIWAGPKGRPESWAISHWSKKLSRGEIERFGSPTDLQNLPPPTKCNRSHPFFSRLIVVDGRGVTNSTPARKRRPQLESPGVSTAEEASIAPAKHSNLRDENVVLEEGHDTNDKNKKKHKKNTAVLLVAHLGIHDCRTSNEIAFKVFDSSIPDSQYRKLSRNPKSQIPTLDIRHSSLENLKSQGKMLDSFVVTAYFKTLGRQYYNDGVRVVDDTFMKWLTIDSSEQMMKRYRLAEIDSAKILLIPIFKGSINCGHFSLVVIDRLTSILVYYGSFSAIDEAACAEVLECLVRKGFAGKDMVRTSRMIEQGANTNDCGAFTCCMASSHIKAMISFGGFVNAQALQQAVVATTKVKLTLDSPTLWGKYARHHVGDALKNRVINMDDPALLSMTVEITRMMEAVGKS
jgi:hypothetical protein